MQQPFGEPGGRFQRMAERVAEIEQRALAALALVARHRAGLGPAAHRDGMLPRRAACEDIPPVGFQPGEEGLVADQSVFDDLGIAGAEFTRGQGVEQRRIRDNENWLLESADQILAVLRIDSGLAADRGIHLRQQRGRNLRHFQSAPHHCRRETGEITDHAAAKRHHHIAALNALRDQRFAYALEYAEAFRLLALRHDDADGS